jgi:hypothetical protein
MLSCCRRALYDGIPLFNFGTGVDKRVGTRKMMTTTEDDDDDD